MRTEEEIREILDGKSNAETKFYSLPYIDGVMDALNWVLEDEETVEPFRDYDEEEDQ